MDEDILLSLLSDTFGGDVPDWVQQELPPREDKQALTYKERIKAQQRRCDDGHCCVFNFNYHRKFAFYHHNHTHCTHECNEQCKSHNIEVPPMKGLKPPVYLKFASRLKWKKLGMLRKKHAMHK